MEQVNSTNIASNRARGASGITGKAILITGGGSGLGAAMASVLADAGAHIMIADKNRDSVEQVEQTLSNTDNTDARVQSMVLDVGDPEASEHLIRQTVRRFGAIDVLINNAGTDVTLPIDDLDYTDWERVIRTNLHGPFLLSKFAAIQMKRQQAGQIINIASTAAKRTWPNASAYHASKWGLLGLSHALHAELRPFGIKVTAVIAGGMRTPFLLDRFPDIDTSALQDPFSVALTVKSVLMLPTETVIPEIMVLPMRETSWP